MSNGSDIGGRILDQAAALALKSLPDILAGVLGGLAGPGNDLLNNIEHGLGRSLEKIGGHTEGQGLGRSLCKTIDEVFKNSQLTAEQKVAVARGLAANIAAGLEALKAQITVYPDLQAAVANAPNDAAANAARGPRNDGVVAIKSGFAALIDAAAGNVPSTPAPAPQPAPSPAPAPQA